MSSDFRSRLSGPSEYTTNPLKINIERISLEGGKEVGRRMEGTGNTYHTMASLGIVNISAGS